MRTDFCQTAFRALYALSFFISVLHGPAAVSASDRIAARVGDAIITVDELRNAAANYVPEGAYHAAVDRSENPEYRTAALNGMIEKELLALEAKKRGLKPPDEEVEAVVANNIKRFGSKDALSRALESSGLSLDGLREMIRKSILSKLLLKQMTAESVYSEDELRKYYTDTISKYRYPPAVFLYGIMLNVDPSAPESAWQEKKKLAEELREKIIKGEDFGLVAYRSSEDRYKYKSGEMGYVHRGRLTPQELEDEAFRLKKDEVSGVIRTIYGFHILKAGERKEGETKSFEEVKSGLRKDLEKKRFEAARAALLEKLKTEYPVYINPGVLDNPEKK